MSVKYAIIVRGGMVESVHSSDGSSVSHIEVIDLDGQNMGDPIDIATCRQCGHSDGFIVNDEDTRPDGRSPGECWVCGHKIS